MIDANYFLCRYVATRTGGNLRIDSRARINAITV